MGTRQTTRGLTMDQRIRTGYLKAAAGEESKTARRSTSEAEDSGETAPSVSKVVNSLAHYGNCAVVAKTNSGYTYSKFKSGLEASVNAKDGQVKWLNGRAALRGGHGSDYPDSFLEPIRQLRQVNGLKVLAFENVDFAASKKDISRAVTGYLAVAIETQQEIQRSGSSRHQNDRLYKGIGVLLLGHGQAEQQLGETVRDESSAWFFMNGEWYSLDESGQVRLNVEAASLSPRQPALHKSSLSKPDQPIQVTTSFPIGGPRLGEIGASEGHVYLTKPQLT